MASEHSGPVECLTTLRRVLTGIHMQTTAIVDGYCVDVVVDAKVGATERTFLVSAIEQSPDQWFLMQIMKPKPPTRTPMLRAVYSGPQLMTLHIVLGVLTVTLRRCPYCHAAYALADHSVGASASHMPLAAACEYLGADLIQPPTLRDEAPAPLPPHIDEIADLKDTHAALIQHHIARLRRTAPPAGVIFGASPVLYSVTTPGRGTVYFDVCPTVAKQGLWPVRENDVPKLLTVAPYPPDLMRGQCVPLKTPYAPGPPSEPSAEPPAGD